MLEGFEMFWRSLGSFGVIGSLGFFGAIGSLGFFGAIESLGFFGVIGGIECVYGDWGVLG